jgi:hypothetical protein
LNSRQKTRERKQKRIKEEKIERSSHNHLDLTAYEAVNNIVKQQKRGETDKYRSN